MELSISDFILGLSSCFHLACTREGWFFALLCCFQSFLKQWMESSGEKPSSGCGFLLYLQMCARWGWSLNSHASQLLAFSSLLKTLAEFFLFFCMVLSVSSCTQPQVSPCSCPICPWRVFISLDFRLLDSI